MYSFFLKKKSNSLTLQCCWMAEIPNVKFHTVTYLATSRQKVFSLCLDNAKAVSSFFSRGRVTVEVVI